MILFDSNLFILFIKNVIGLGDKIVGKSCISHFAYETYRVIKSQNVKYAWSTIRLLYSLDTNWFNRPFLLHLCERQFVGARISYNDWYYDRLNFKSQIFWILTCFETIILKLINRPHISYLRLYYFRNPIYHVSFYQALKYIICYHKIYFLIFAS